MTNAERDCIIRYRQSGKSCAEIARVLGLSANTVKSFCQRNRMAPSTQAELSALSETVCLCCGEKIEILPHRKTKRFCSDACRYAWAYSHRILGPQNAIQKQCAACKKSFFSYPSSHRKYCSHGCYIADRYGREAERHG